MHNKITIITVTFNNESGLRKTLSSISKLTLKPYEVIVIDGKSKDNTISVINEYMAILRIRSISESDDGIYDAMNKGLKMVQTDLVHYLNGGDEVYGEPYIGVCGPSLLPAIIRDIATSSSWGDEISLCGYGYCHQGVIFPSGHRAYDTRYMYAADVDLIISVFPNGLRELNISKSGGVVYYLDGSSSINNVKGDLEILDIFKKRSGTLNYFFVKVYIFFKSLVPRKVRRWVKFRETLQKSA